MRLIVSAVFLVMVVGPAAAMSTEQCQSELKSVQGAADTMATLVQAIKKRDSASFARDAKGGLKDALYKFEEARQRLIPAIDEYARAMDDIAQQMRICARGR